VSEVFPIADLFSLYISTSLAVAVCRCVLATRDPARTPFVEGIDL
jgi:hypothetical protein